MSLGNFDRILCFKLLEIEEILFFVVLQVKTIRMRKVIRISSGSCPHNNKNRMYFKRSQKNVAPPDSCN